MPAPFLPILLGITLLLGLARGSELFAPSPIEEVSVRNLPAVDVLETESTGSLESVWSRGFLHGARFAAQAHSSLNTPTILTLPDWEKAPLIKGNHVHLIMHCLLDPLPNFPEVREPGAVLRQLPAMTVACYAQRGNYTPESFVAGLQKIEAYIKARHIPVTGPPRYLYYTTTGWMPSWWKISEVEVPIAAGAGG